MPIPSSPAEWAAIGEKRAHADYEVQQSWASLADAAPYSTLDLAAAARLLERERVENEHVERLAAERARVDNRESPNDADRTEARRILGVAS